MELGNETPEPELNQNSKGTLVVSEVSIIDYIILSFLERKPAGYRTLCNYVYCQLNRLGKHGP
jgi:hypothetical protein